MNAALMGNGHDDPEFVLSTQRSASTLAVVPLNSIRNLKLKVVLQLGSHHALARYVGVMLGQWQIKRKLL